MESQGSGKKLSRRKLLARGSLGAAAVWTAPVVSSVVAPRAAATPAPCSCTGFAAGIFGEFNSPNSPPPFPTHGDTSGGTSFGAKDCDQSFSDSLGELGSISAAGTCGEFDAQTCTARATFGEGSFTITIFGLTVSGSLIESSITTSGCSCEVVASASAVNVKIGDAAPFTGPLPPNTPVNLSGPLGTVDIILNRQFCDGDESVVQAVSISGVGTTGTLAGATGFFVLSESRVLTTGCDCPLPFA